MTPAEKAARAELLRLKALQSGQGRSILAVDPGTSATGICLLVDGDPQWIKILREKGPNAEARLPGMCLQVSGAIYDAIRFGTVDTVAIEWQSIRPTDQRPNDILHLGMVIGAALAGIPQSSQIDLLTPLPVQWKGTQNADLFVRRIRERFPLAANMMHSVPESLKHNGFDALGLALWAINKALPWKV